MRLHLTALLVAAGIALVVGACFEGPPPVRADYRFSCVEHTDCKGELVCFEGLCVAPELALPSKVDAGDELLDAGGGPALPAVVSTIPLLPSVGATPPLCAASGWCWVSPRPRGFSQCSVAMAAPGVAFVVLDGQLFRLTAQYGLEPIAVDNTSPLSSVVATGPSSGVVSQVSGQTLHFSRGAPTFIGGLPDGGLQGLRLFATEAGDLWAYDGNQSALLQFDNTSRRWLNVPFPPGGWRLQHLAPAAAQEAYANFTSANFQMNVQFRYLNGTWAPVSDAGVRCLWGESPERIIISVPGSTAMHGRLTPTGLQPLVTGTDVCVAGEADGDLFGYLNTGVSSGIAAAFGNQWTTLVAEVNVTALSMRGRDGVACGPNTLLLTVGSIWHSAMSAVSGDITETPKPSTFVMRDDGSAYVFGDGTWVITPSSATKVPVLTMVSRMVRAGDAYVASTRDGLFRFDGGALGQVMPGTDTLVADHFQIFDMAADGPDNVWLVGRGGQFPDERAATAHWNGATWALVPPPPTPGSAVDGVAAAGNSGWVLTNGRLYLATNETWEDQGVAPTGFTTGELAGLSSRQVLIANSSGVMRWTADAGWAKEYDQAVRAIATDPSSGTAMLYTQAGRAMWRQPNGLWFAMELPGALAPSGTLAAGVRGNRAWLGDANGAIMTKQ